MGTRTMPVTEGFAPFDVPGAGERCQTWYKAIGDLHAPDRRPLVVVHGGPGLAHDYLLPLTDLFTRSSIPLLFYDQLGSGRSTHLRARAGDGAFWTDALFMAQLDALLAHLGVRACDALGHSWGGMLLARYAAARPGLVGRLVIASAPADMGLWAQNLKVLRAGLPRSVQDVLDAHEARGTTDVAEYAAAVGVFYARHVCLLDPMPAELAAVFAQLEEDPTVYHTMYGRHEFDMRGTLKDWTAVPDLGKITAPTLLLNGRHDEAQDAVMAPFFRGIRRVRWYTFGTSSHMAHYEEREKYMDVVGGFLSGDD